MTNEENEFYLCWIAGEDTCQYQRERGDRIICDSLEIWRQCVEKEDLTEEEVRELFKQKRLKE